MPVKHYWFYLESFVYVAIKGNDLLVYNSLTGEFLSYPESPNIVEFLLELNRKENLYALKVTREYLSDNRLEGFVEDVLNKFMGDLIDISIAPVKPFLMAPYFDIVQTRDTPGPRTVKNVSHDSIFSLDELTFYVNSQCSSNCTVCNSAFKQFMWCAADKQNTQLELNHIKNVLEQVRGCPIKTVNIIGGNLALYSGLEQLIDLLAPCLFNVNYYFHLSHLQSRTRGIPGIIRGDGLPGNLILLVDCSAFSPDRDLKTLKDLKPGKLVFLIRGEDEIPLLEQAIEELPTHNIAIQPFFNGKNIDFFRDNVFTDFESLRESKPDIPVIKSRQSFNTLNYGKLIVNNDLNIYSNLNAEPLGKVTEISMEKAVVTELTQHGNWLKVRRDFSPCKECLLDSICPPVSNFENATRIYKTCNIPEGNQR